MKKNTLPFRLFSQIRIRHGVIALFAAIILSVSMNVAAQGTASLAGQKCPASVHDSYTTIGPDGNVYPTWHPPVDPTLGCWFDHEHGSDPHTFVGFASTGMPAFGYTAKQAGLTEPEEGYKVYVANDDGSGHAWMAVLHQGSRGAARATTQFHSLEWDFTTTSGQPLALIKTMADFGYGSPNCATPTDPTPGFGIQIPNSGTGVYPFESHQPQRRFVPTIGCAALTPYETWTPLINIANKTFAATATFDISNPTVVINPDNIKDVRYMCEFKSPNEDCASFYNTQWAGNKRGVIAPNIQVSNTGSSDVFVDPYGKTVAAGTPGSIKEFIAPGKWSITPCFCNDDIFAARLDTVYRRNPLQSDTDRLMNGFPFGPNALQSPPPVNPPPVNPPPTLPTGPTVIVFVANKTANVGDNVEVDIAAANLTGLYGLQTQCVVDPNVLTGTGHADGTVFTSNNSFFVDNGFQAGNWTVAASLLQPNPAFTGAALAYKLNFKVQNAGSSAVTCTALAVDVNGKELPATIINGSFNGAPVAPPVNPPPVNPPPVNPPPVDTPVPPPAQLSTISGAAAYQNHPSNAGITVILKAGDNVLATVTTNADGKYNFTNVPVGNYTVVASAPECITVSKAANVTADGQAVAVNKLTLPAGDTDNSGTIDLLDASLIGANFSGVVPPSPSTADLNADGKVDIRDLALIGGNFGLTGPITTP